ncbi:MAG: thermonuclease family protein [Dehalococcoidia bacterium]|nr:thermonuclease family protein [Dehalococcoidia bacterium]
MSLRSYKVKVRVTRVVDGDSLVVARRRWFNFMLKPKPFAVRLYAIDAPELSQPYGTDARNEMRRISSGSLRLDAVSSDRYGRVVGVVYRRNRKKSLNHMMVAAGLAYSYQRYGKLDGIDEAEARARKRRLGIWKAGKSQTRPWDHRRSMRSRVRRKRAARWWLRIVAFLILVGAILFGMNWLWQSVGDLIRSALGG